MQRILILAAFVFLFSCIKENNTIKDFIQQDINFDKYQGYSFIRRGNDNNGNLIVVVSKYLNAKGVYFIHYNVENDNITFRNEKYLNKDKIDFIKVEALAKDFIKLGIFSLSVDTSKNVFLRLDQTQKYLIVNDFKILRSKKYVGDYRKIAKNWYEINL